MKTGRGHCSGRLILLIAASLLSAFTLYFTSRGSPIGALDEQWQFYQLATSKNYAQDAKKATSALQALFQKDIEIPDLAERGRRVSALSNLFRALIKDPRINRDEFFYFRNREFGYWKALSPTYLPWAAPARPETGIVLCVGVKDFVLAVHNIQVLRNVLGSTLPIEIFYAGDGDLPEEKRKEFEALGPNIQTRNILNDFDDGIAGIGEILTGNGFVMKPFALLASRFERVILLDADIIFLQRPDASFDEDIHLKKTGTLFYHDRAVTESANTGWTDTLAWIKERVLRGRQPSTMLEKSIFWTAKLEHQQESGVVFMDKAKPGVFVSLLFATWMNTKAARAYLYKHVYGESCPFYISTNVGFSARHSTRRR